MKENINKQKNKNHGIRIIKTNSVAEIRFRN